MEEILKKQSKFSLKQRVIALIIILVILSGTGLGVYKYSESRKKASIQSTTIQENKSEKLKVEVVNEKGELSAYTTNLKEGTSAFDALKQLKSENKGFTFEFKEYSFGPFITSINGFQPDSSKQFWSFYVNDKVSSEGVGAYKIKKGDIIKFKVENIQ